MVMAMMVTVSVAAVIVASRIVMIVGMKQAQKTTPYSADGCSADLGDAAGSAGRVNVRKSMVGALAPPSR